MKFTSEVIVDRPRERVLELIMAPGNFSKWQPGVKSFELLSGELGCPGARARVVVDMYGLKLEMTETIVERKMPDVYTLRYEGKGVKNLVENRFYEDGPGKTRWVINSTLEFSPFAAVAAGFIKDTIVKQNHESMKKFKTFAEKS